MNRHYRTLITMEYNMTELGMERSVIHEIMEEYISQLTNSELFWLKTYCKMRIIWDRIFTGV